MRKLRIIAIFSLVGALSLGLAGCGDDSVKQEVSQVSKAQDATDQLNQQLNGEADEVKNQLGK